MLLTVSDSVRSFVSSREGRQDKIKKNGIGFFLTDGKNNPIREDN
jgi:hypothetical protein